MRLFSVSFLYLSRVVVFTVQKCKWNAFQIHTWGICWYIFCIRIL